MITLWFKAHMVAKIMAGRKTFTVRRHSRWMDHAEPGALLGASVGPRPLFARLRITRIRRVTLRELPAGYGAKLRRCFDSIPRHLVRIDFSVAESL